MMDLYKMGEVVVIPFPFIESELSKRRPAVVLSGEEFNSKHSFLILGMVTTASQSHEASDIKIKDWKMAGLKKPCVFRFKIFSLQKNLILEKVGKLSSLDQGRVSSKLHQIL